MAAARTTTQRGYGVDHQRARARWQRIVDTGEAACTRCKLPIGPNDPWDLGHDDHDRAKYTGPEHPACNRAEGGRNAHEVNRLTRRDW